MLLNEKDIIDFKDSLRGYSPLLSLQRISSEYRDALLQRMMNDDVFDIIEMFSHEIGSLRLKKNKKHFILKSNTTDTAQFLRGHLDFPDEKKLVVLDIPIEMYQDISIQSLVIAFARKIRKQKSPARLLLSHQGVLPDIFSHWIDDIEFSIPRRENNLGKLDYYVTNLLKQSFKSIDLKDSDLIIRALQGLPADTIANIISCVAHDKQRKESKKYSCKELLSDIRNKRDQSLKSTSGLEVIPSNISEKDLGGFNYLKRYVQYQAKILSQKEDATRAGVDIPKGFLLVGLPGCGKSLAAEVASSFMNLPLLRLDMGSLMGKYLGESEQNLANILNVATASAPCILWIDEIEKALGGLSGDSNGTGKRMLGKLLTWMQEQKQGVYMIATANSIDSLPPELTRRGRFDELFRVDLPTEQERRKILEIHLRKRQEERSLSNADMIKLAGELTQNFTGADLEALVKEVKIHSWIQHAKKVTLAHFEKILPHFTPLSKQFEGKIEELSKDLEKSGFRNVSIDEDKLDSIIPPIEIKDIPLPKSLRDIVDSSQRLVFNIEKTDFYLLITGNGMAERKFGFITDPELDKHEWLFSAKKANTLLTLAPLMPHKLPSFLLKISNIELISDKNQIYLRYNNPQQTSETSLQLHLRKQQTSEVFPKKLYDWLWSSKVICLKKGNQELSIQRITNRSNNTPFWLLRVNNGEKNSCVAKYEASIRHDNIFLFLHNIEEGFRKIANNYLGFIVSINSNEIFLNEVPSEHIESELVKEKINFNDWYNKIQDAYRLQPSSNPNVFKVPLNKNNNTLSFSHETWSLQEIEELQQHWLSERIDGLERCPICSEWIHRGNLVGHYYDFHDLNLTRERQTLNEIKDLVKINFKQANMSCPTCNNRMRPRNLIKHYAKAHPREIPPTSTSELDKWINKNKKAGKIKLLCPFCNAGAAIQEMYLHIRNCNDKPI